jgi:trans-aconitate 2-methyltransferase
MTSWDPGEYMRFGDERTRPSVDLAARIAVESPARVIDLGCGPGNSTRVLRARWPEACIVGLDSSPEMIETARSEQPEEEWVLADIDHWTADSPFDVVFSNAALQWVPDHATLVESLMANVALGGALAFQIPSADFASVRTLIQDIANEGPWADRMAGPLGELTMEEPGLYYDRLAPLARTIDIWETTYFHVMDSAPAIVEWIASTGLRPYLAALESEEETQAFVSMLHERVVRSYRPQLDGKVLFPFKRMFVIGYR